MNVDFVQVSKDGQDKFALKITLKSGQENLPNLRLFGGFCIAEQPENEMEEPRYLSNHGWQSEVHWFPLTDSGQSTDSRAQRYILLPDSVAEQIEPGRYEAQFGGQKHYSFRRFETTIQDFNPIQWKSHEVIGAQTSGANPAQQTEGDPIALEQGQEGQAGQERPQTAAQSTAALSADNAVIGEIPAILEDSPSAAVTQSPSRRSPLPLVLGGAAVLAAAGVGAWFYLQQAADTPKPAVTTTQKQTGTSSPSSATVAPEATSTTAPSSTQTSATVASSESPTSVAPPATAEPKTPSSALSPASSEAETTAETVAETAAETTAESKASSVPAVSSPPAVKLVLAADKIQVSHQSNAAITFQSCDTAQINVEDNNLTYRRLPGVNGQQTFTCSIRQDGQDGQQAFDVDVRPLALTLTLPTAADDRLDLPDWFARRTGIEAEEIFCPGLRFGDNLRLNGRYLVYNTNNPADLQAFSCNIITKDSGFSLKIFPEVKP